MTFFAVMFSHQWPDAASITVDRSMLAMDGLELREGGGCPLVGGAASRRSGAPPRAAYGSRPGGTRSEDSRADVTPKT